MTATLWPARLWGAGAKPHGAKWEPNKCLPFLQSREGWLVVAKSVGVTLAKLLQPPGLRHAGHCGCERSREPWTRMRPEKGALTLPSGAPAWLPWAARHCPPHSCPVAPPALRETPQGAGHRAGGGVPCSLGASWEGFSTLILEYQCQTGRLNFFY